MARQNTWAAAGQRILADEFGSEFEQIEAYARCFGPDVFARQFTDAINQELATNEQLPGGFEIKLHPRGVDLETLLAQEQQNQLEA